MSTTSYYDGDGVEGSTQVSLSSYYGDYSAILPHKAVSGS